MLTKDEEIKARGCKSVTKIIIPDEKLQDLANYLSTLPIIKKSYGVHRMHEKDIIHDGQAFFNEYLKLHKIPHFKIIKTPISNKSIVSIRNIHPYKLPIEHEEDIYNGYLNEVITPDRNNVLFKSIVFNPNTTELFSSSYVHEITHSQLNSIRGSYEDYFNQEVLSIFLELIHAKEVSEHEKILRIQEANRVYEISELTKEQIEFATGRLDLSREDQIENSKYIQSDLIALRLFSIYYFSHYSIQKEILMKVQEVFNGEITVEEFLEAFGVSFENSQDKKMLGKYLNRIV